MGKNVVQLSESESVILEYKSTIDANAIRKTTVAFANTQGGVLKIGVAKNHTVVGIDQGTVDQVTQIARDGSIPPLNPQVGIEYHDDKTIIVVAIKNQRNVPYCTTSGVYYVRVGATTRKASLSELIDLIIKGPHSGTITMRMRLLELIAKIHAGIQHDEKHALTSLSELEWLLGLSMDMGTKGRVAEMLRNLIPNCKNEQIFREILDVLVHMSSNLLHTSQATPEQIDNFLDNDGNFTSKNIFDHIVSTMKHTFFMLTLDQKITPFIRIVINRIYRLGLICIGSDDTERLDKILNILSKHSKDQQLNQSCEQAIQQLRKCVQDEEEGSDLLAWFKPLPAGPY